LTGSNWLNWRTQAIVKAIGEAGKSLRSSEIAELTGLHYRRWGSTLTGTCERYYGLTPQGAAKLETLS